MEQLRQVVMTIDLNWVNYKLAQWGEINTKYSESLIQECHEEIERSKRIREESRKLIKQSRLLSERLKVDVL